MKNPKIHALTITMDLSEDYRSCRCECKTTVTEQEVLGAMLASAVVSIARGHSRDPRAFARAVTLAIEEFINKPGFFKTKSKIILGGHHDQNHF